MNRLLNYFLLFVLILILVGLVVPFAILQVQVNSNSGGDSQEIINQILNRDLKFGPNRNALIFGILLPCLATILLAVQQYFYFRFLKTKMEFPVKTKLIKQYQWVGIGTGGLIALTLLFFICAFNVGNKWDVRKYLYIGGIVVNSLYGIGIYICAIIVNMHIIYDQARQQAILNSQSDDKNPPQDDQHQIDDGSQTNNNDDSTTETNNESQPTGIDTKAPECHEEDAKLASAGNF